ncbi:MAG: 4-hydroxythreonine-4-phosphate dehydrogenase PdxA [Ignavibacteriaceae bacterium]|nr:4-hydroxythreonine-4-phosphate dehydrogenase PdxA [Ignavibacteriaceae bacterium]
MNTFIFTCGDINGIGPEIIIKSLNKLHKLPGKRFIFIIPRNIFELTAGIVNPEFNFLVTNNLNDLNKKDVMVYDLGIGHQVLGSVTKEAGKVAYSAIKQSFSLLQNQSADAVITAPISKAAIHKFGIKFPGHTEIYSEWCGVNDFVMMFLSSEMNAALVTIHEPLKNITKLINQKILKQTILTIKNTLQSDLAQKDIKIAVLGLNPHAGESGQIGSEEEKIIIPALKNFSFCEGPFSSDAFFANKLYKKYDCVLGMYHDQLLIPFKMLNFSSGVNYTAGLPIVRTSPDHGTAFDIAGQGIANESSMLQAFRYADIIVNNRKRINDQG